MSGKVFNFSLTILEFQKDEFSNVLEHCIWWSTFTKKTEFDAVPALSQQLGAAEHCLSNYCPSTV